METYLIHCLKINSKSPVNECPYSVGLKENARQYYVYLLFPYANHNCNEEMPCNSKPDTEVQKQHTTDILEAEQVAEQQHKADEKVAIKTEDKQRKADEKEAIKAAEKQRKADEKEAIKAAEKQRKADEKAAIKAAEKQRKADEKAAEEAAQTKQQEEEAAREAAEKKQQEEEAAREAAEKMRQEVVRKELLEKASKAIDAIPDGFIQRKFGQHPHFFREGRAHNLKKRTEGMSIEELARFCPYLHCSGVVSGACVCEGKGWNMGFHYEVVTCNEGAKVSNLDTRSCDIECNPS